MYTSLYQFSVRIFCLVLVASFYSCQTGDKNKAETADKKENGLIDSIAVKTNNLTELRKRLADADTVLLVSHENTTEPVYNKKTGKSSEAPELMINGFPNSKVMREEKLIQREVLTTLSEILTSPPNIDSISPQAKCFSPHHAIFIIKEGHYSYLDICFSCNSLAVSNDLSVSHDDFDNKKWKALYDFVKGLGIKYEL
jgi:hypothetical protein